ncbi:MAG: tetratricopeptide repeat protein, partial [Flavobacteriaceae bacterium]
MIRRASRLAILVAVAGFVHAGAPASAADGEVVVGRTFSGNYLAGRLAYSVKDTSAAATFFRGALAIDPEATQLYDDTLILELASGHEEEAAKLATRMVKMDGRNRLARLLLGVRSFRARQYADARKHQAELDGSPLSELTAGLLSAWTYLGAGDAKGA